ncbi:hypothetical protein DXG01_011534 [Tephrocybe rancida]|nr:hypothetical protein DXG01_011534 [Tephrocybe rancida]
MAQPIIPHDTKTPPPASPPPVNASSLPPSYPSSFSPYPQPQQPSFQPPNGAPPQQPYATLPLGTAPPQLPYGAQPPIGNLSPQHTGYGALPGQQVPMGQLPQQQIPYGAQPHLGNLSPQHTGYGSLSGVPLNVPQQQQPPQAIYVQPQAPALAGQAQIGAQYQAARSSLFSVTYALIRADSSHISEYAQCAAGNHSRHTKYGVVGIILAVVFFPIGLLCMLADKEETQEVQAPPYQLDHHTPQPQFAPQAQWQPPVQPPAQALSAAQVGEQYRSARM